MLGIIIGIASVLIVLILGNGMEASMNSELSRGAVQINVKLDPTKTDKFFDREAYKSIEEAYGDTIYGINANWTEYDGSVAGIRGKECGVFVEAGGAAYKQASDLTILSGRFYSAEEVHDSAHVCVIPEVACKMIFGYDDVVGRTLVLSAKSKSTEFTIVGICKNSSSDEQYAKFDDITMYMPYTAVCDVYGYNSDEKLTSIALVTDISKKEEVLAKSKSVVENLLGIRGQGAVKVSEAGGLGALGNILGMVKSVVILIAAISLVVGGIGVMNIMTVSVTERTREIGIRKSIGARTSSIMVQFLAEAAILTVIGGLIGLGLGVGLAFAATKIAEFPFVVHPEEVVVVVGISVFIGLFFGIAPARKAAKLNPIDALHTD